MGCSKCYQCGDKFEDYDAEEYARENGWESDAEDEDSCDEDAPPGPNYEMCPGCLRREETRKEEKRIAQARETELVALRKEVNELRKKVAASANGEPAKKKSKVSEKVWVIVKGDWPDHPGAKLVDVDVLGTYSSHEKAEAAKEEFLEDGGWEKGYGYHQGESESTIKIVSSTMDVSVV